MSEERNNSYQITGHIVSDYGTKEYGSNGFTKREFVIETDEKYPQPVRFELVKDKCSVLDNFGINDVVRVSFNIRGRDYNGKTYNDNRAWRVEQIASSAAPTSEPAPTSHDPVQAGLDGLDDNAAGGGTDESCPF